MKPRCGPREHRPHYLGWLGPRPTSPSTRARGRSRCGTRRRRSTSPTNGRGSIGSVLSTTSTIACQAADDPFGGQLGAAGTTSATTCTSTVTPNDRWYNAARRDETTGNYQLGSRTYDPAKASFLTPDTYRAAGSAADAALGTARTANRYGYVNGDAVNFTDPSGHEPHPNRDGSWSGAGCASGQCSDRSGPSAGDVRLAEDYPCWVDFECTSRDFDAMSIRQRRAFISYLHGTHAAKFHAENWFNAIDAVLRFAGDNKDNGKSESSWKAGGSWFSLVDSEILAAIHDGFALALGHEMISRGEGRTENLLATRNPGAVHWRDFLRFRSQHEEDYDQSLKLWSIAEQTATEYG
jgi:RHS repeat-associated protein